jgi:hypothetical protein
MPDWTRHAGFEATNWEARGQLVYGVRLRRNVVYLVCGVLVSVFRAARAGDGSAEAVSFLSLSEALSQTPEI